MSIFQINIDSTDKNTEIDAISTPHARIGPFALPASYADGYKSRL